MYTHSHDVISDVDMRQAFSVTKDAHQVVLVLRGDPAMTTEEAAISAAMSRRNRSSVFVRLVMSEREG